MAKKENSRRRFLKQSSLTGLGAALGLGVTMPSLSQSIIDENTAPANKEKQLRIKPRYHRWHVDPGVEWLETNTGYANLDWAIPLSQTALVLLDVWQRHYIKETQERAEIIINNKYLPLIAKCREEGIQLIHAPSYPVAIRSSNWIKLAPEPDRYFKPDSWPSSDFLDKKGKFQAYSRPVEPREKERQALPALDFHPKIKPIGNEPVVGSGEELHQYCKKNGKLFLLYAGFNTNACILTRTYGAVQMNLRGYEVVLLRDCTTGMETRETQPELRQTNGAILLLEMFGQYTATSDEVLNGIA
jgi:nicotinamidase-related amidase